MSPHEFFKVFLLYSDYRPSVDRPSTERWPITDRYISEVSTNYRRSVGEKSAKCRWSIGERKAISAETHLERLSTVSRPSVVRLSSESRPTIDRYIDRVSTDYRPSVNRVSTDYRPLYRPIDRSTLSTVNMMISQPLFTRLACLGLSPIPVKERERVSGKVSNINRRFLSSCLANSPSVYIYTVKGTL